VPNCLTMDEIQEDLGSSPEQFPHGFNVRDDSVAFVRLTRADYEAASFLDARILTPGRASVNLPWPQVAAAIDASRLAEACDYIFHIGHVGSTLLSRLIGAHRGAFALREPAVLRTFAQLGDGLDAEPRARRDADFEERLGGCLKLLSRTFDAQQIAVIKATSFVSELAAGLLSRPSSPKALKLHRHHPGRAEFAAGSKGARAGPLTAPTSAPGQRDMATRAAQRGRNTGPGVGVRNDGAGAGRKRRWRARAAA